MKSHLNIRYHHANTFAFKCLALRMIIKEEDWRQQSKHKATHQNSGNDLPNNKRAERNSAESWVD